MIDPEKRNAAVRLAAGVYRHRSYHDEGPDALLKLADLLDRVWELLCPAANANRLSTAIAEDSSGSPAPCVSDFAALVHRYERLARAAHRGRGKPPRKPGLEVAYRVLADFWREQHGVQNFTSGWSKTKDSLAPTSPAACFLFDAMREIDAERPRLAEELRDLMAADVAARPEARAQGRRLG